MNRTGAKTVPRPLSTLMDSDGMAREAEYRAHTHSREEEFDKVESLWEERGRFGGGRPPFSRKGASPLRSRSFLD